MSLTYSVEVFIKGKFERKNIENILNNGISMGFIYYDFILGEAYENASILNANEAAERVINGHEQNIDISSPIYGQINERTMHIWFYKNGSDMEVHIGSFGNIFKHDFPLSDNYFFINFDWYIRLLLDLCKGYAILKLKTDYF